VLAAAPKVAGAAARRLRLSELRPSSQGRGR